MATFETNDSLLKVTGALDPESEQGLKDACAGILAGTAGTVTLDLTGVDYANSISIGLLVALCMDLRSAGRRAIMQPSKFVKKTLDMTGLTETFALAAKPVEPPAKQRGKSKKADF
jgi:anti-anti-sigma factor